MRTEAAVDAALGRIRPRLSTNVRWTLLGTAAHSVSQWLQFAILARAGGPEAVGRYALALALTAPVMSFAALQLRALLASDPAERFVFREYRALASITAAIGLVACGALALVTGAGRGAWSILAAVCVMRVTDSLADVYYGLWQQQERMHMIGLGRVVHAVFSTFLVALGAGVGGAESAVWGAALGSAVAYAFIHTITVRDTLARHALLRGPERPSTRRLLELAAEGLPMGVILLLSTLQTTVPRYFVDALLGSGALGLFAAAAQLTAAGNVFVGALGSAALPRLAAHAAGNTKAFRALTRKLLLAGAALGAAGVAASALVGRWVLQLVYGAPFGDGEGLLVVLSVAAASGFVASLLGYALTSARIIVAQPAILIVTLGALTALCAVLVPALGTSGAAWALAVAYVVQGVASRIVLRRSWTGAASGAATVSR